MTHNSDVNHCGVPEKLTKATDEGYKVQSASTVGSLFPLTEQNTVQSLANGETIPLKTSIENTKDSVGKPETKVSAWWGKMKSDAMYREKVLLSLSICWSFVILGWVIGQSGPSFLDLQIITSTQLDKASGFLASTAVGYLVGSLISGILFDKYDKTLLLCCFTFSGALVFAVIPWCFRYEVMIAMQFCRGFYGGGIESGGNALLLSKWGQDGRSFMQVLHFAFAFGGIISPMVTAPFLLEERESVEANKPNFDMFLLHTPWSLSNHTFNSFNARLDTMTASQNMSRSRPYKPEDSRLYIPFSITAAMHLAGALPLLVIYLRARQKNSKTSWITQEEYTNRITRELKIGSTVLMLVSVCLFIFLYVAVEDSFNSFLTTFCVNYLDWTKAEGSFATSLFWASFGACRFLGIWIIKLVPAAKLLCGFSVALMIIFAVLVVFSETMTNAGVWVCSVGVGAAMSIVFPTVFTWTEDALLPVTGKVSSLITVASSIGAIINPILLGYLMDTFSPLWFSYLLFGESVLSVILLFNLLLIARFYNINYIVIDSESS